MQVLWLLVLCLHSLVFWGWRGIYLQKNFFCKYTWVFSFDTRFLDFCIGIQRDKKTKTKKLCCYWHHCRLSRILKIFLNLGITWHHLLWLAPLYHLSSQAPHLYFYAWDCRVFQTSPQGHPHWPWPRTCCYIIFCPFFGYSPLSII